MTDAHAITQNYAIVETFPAHEPRKSDPHYHVFNAARTRLKKLGKLICWIGNGDCAGGIELHHATVEFSLSNDVDEAKFAKLYPEFQIPDDNAFLDWVESEGNLLPLCVMHHRGVLGVHSIHYPAWLVQRFMKDGVAPPEKLRTGSEAIKTMRQIKTS